MRLLVSTVFDAKIYGATTFYTSSEFNELLGSVRRFGIHVVADEVQGTSPTLTIAVETSDNGRQWISVSNALDQTNLTANTTNSLAGVFSGSLLHFVRLAITIGGTSNPGARVAIYACLRGRGSQPGPATTGIVGRRTF